MLFVSLSKVHLRRRRGKRPPRGVRRSLPHAEALSTLPDPALPAASSLPHREIPMAANHRSVDRRDFLRHSLVAGAGAAALGRVPDLSASPRSSAAGVPVLLTSHTNETGQAAARAGWDILMEGGSPADAIERTANLIEDDPNDASVGYGGMPNADGVVQLDASFMDGRTYNAGAVASIENIKTPSSVARLVMDRTDHVMLVGPGALEFAQ